jgi:hypothetical protein
MSFDVFLLKFDKGDPACGLPQGAFHAVIQKDDVRQRGEDFYDIRLHDGSFVEVQRGYAPNSRRFTTATFMIRGMSESIVRLLFECAQTTGGVLIPAAGVSPCIMVDVSQRDHLPPDFRQPLVECRSPEELGRLLRDGYQAWSQYRDQIVSGQNRPASDPPPNVAGSC